MKPYYETKLGRLYCGDCLEIMPGLELFNLVLTDPPYNASNKALEFSGKKYRTVNEDWDKNFQCIDFINIAWDKLIKTGSLISFCSVHTLGQYLSWGLPRQILHWTKTNPFPAIAKVYTPSVEYILWYTKGSPYVFNKKIAKTNVLQSCICQGKERTAHPTQKPEVIIKELIRVHSNENEVVLDPFSGSGTTAVSCEKLNRRWIGIEISEEYCEIAAKRIEREAQQLKLFAV